MSKYIYWQQTEDGGWTIAPVERTQAIIKATNPPMMTILALDHPDLDSATAEEIAKVKYLGPFYVDFDSPSIEEAITQFNKFLDKLEEKGVPLNQVALYASGGKGFHALLPTKIFLEKAAPSGITFLPQIYKEMAMQLYVDTLDLRVYSARKGRMFRMPNVQRKNGRYKVSLTVEEVRSMTPDLYVTLTSSPREQVKVEDPELNINMEMLFVSSQDKVTRAIKSRPKNTKDMALIERLDGKFPDGMKMLMGGRVKEGKGFQEIATQLSIAAHALGKTLEEFIQSCEGLIENHKSDGHRYNTPFKRKAELTRMYHYMDGNPCYTFSAGGIKSCLPKGVKTPELDGESISAPESDEIPDYFYDMPEADGDYSGDSESEDEEDEDEGAGITLKMQVNPQGIFRKTEHGMRKICALGITNPIQHMDINSGDIHGYEVQAYMDGKPLRKSMLSMNDLLNKANFMRAISSLGGPGTQITDNEVQAVREILRRKVLKNKGRVYTVGHEGIDIINIPGAPSDHPGEVIWVAKDKVLSHYKDAEFRLKSMYNSTGEMNSDLHHAPHLKATEESLEYFRNFFKLNTKAVVARTFGWYLAGFISPMIRKIFKQYPLLQVVGTAGSGKSSYNALMLQLHYYKTEPKIFGGGNLTPFALNATLAASSSIPILFEELKPREIAKGTLDRIKMALRSNYNGLAVGRGFVDKSKSSNELSVVSMSNKAPIAFVGEAVETQTAILDRCIVVTVTPHGREGTRHIFRHAVTNSHQLSGLGRCCIDAAMGIDMQELQKMVSENEEKIRDAAVDFDISDRVAFNYAVVITGLEFGKEVMGGVFGEEFDAEFDSLKEEIFSKLSSAIPKNLSEKSKVLNTIALMSKGSLSPELTPKFGEDYMTVELSDGRTALDVKLHSVFVKYKQYAKSIGEEALFDGYDAFASALRNHPHLISMQCTGNDEFTSHNTIPAYRFDLEALYHKEGIEEFLGAVATKSVVPHKTKSI